MSSALRYGQSAVCDINNGVEYMDSAITFLTIMVMSIGTGMTLTNARYGLMINTVVGILIAMIGGYAYYLFGIQPRTLAGLFYICFGIFFGFIVWGLAALSDLPDVEYGVFKGVAHGGLVLAIIGVAAIVVHGS